MTSQKDFKRLVRRRMEKTGEAYTAARANVVNARGHRALGSAPPVDYAALAGTADTAVQAKTGCGWAMWVFVLDRVKAYEWPHRDIARHVQDKYHIGSWWAQTVTVGYERIKGLRAVGQLRDGGFRTSKSITLPVPVTRLYRAFRDARVRRKWLADALVIRTAIPERSMRITWPDGTWVHVYFESKGAQKSHVVVEHSRLGSAEGIKQTKADWAVRLAALRRLLE